MTPVALLTCLWRLPVPAAMAPTELAPSLEGKNAALAELLHSHSRMRSNALDIWQLFLCEAPFGVTDSRWQRKAEKLCVRMCLSQCDW